MVCHIYELIKNTNVHVTRDNYQPIETVDYKDQLSASVYVYVCTILMA